MTGVPGSQPPALPMVGGFPEPDGDQPMSPAEFCMVRDFLGVTGAWLASHLRVTLRTVRRWEHGQSPVPDGVREAMEQLEATAGEEVGQLVTELADARDNVLTIPRQGGDYTQGWWRMIAARVAQEVPGLYVQYDEK